MLYTLLRFVGKLRVSKIIYPHIRSLLLFLKLIKHKGKQKYSIGFLKKGVNLRKYLERNGFENDDYAWIDNGEVLSMRKIDKLYFQYHIRLFDDGELKGHYEYIPDGFPIKHWREVCFKNKKGYFNSLLKGKIRNIQ